MQKKINESILNQNQLRQHCIQLLKQCLTKSRSKYAKGGSVGSLMDNGRIDQPIKPL